MTPEPKTYEIHTIADIFEQVPEDRIDHFLADLRGMLEFYHRLSDSMESIAKEEVRTNLLSFRWIDDGQHNMAIDFEKPAPRSIP